MTRDFIPVGIAVLTVSDTRTAADDRSGDTLAERIETAGHRVAAGAATPRGRERARLPEGRAARARRLLVVRVAERRARADRRLR